MEKFFKLKEHGTDVRTEVTAGLTTFFAMSYILFVNPAMLAQTGMPAQGVFLATIIGAVAGTLMMAFYANLPYAQAPGMGLNAFFTYTVVFSLGYTWQEALAMVFLCGVISQNSSIETIFIDSFLTLGDIDTSEGLRIAVDKLAVLSERFHVNFVLSVSQKEEKLPEELNATIWLSL